MSRLSFSKSTVFRGIAQQEDDTVSDQKEYYESTGNWRNIIFLPYKMLWRIIIVGTILMNCLLVTYALGYQQNMKGFRVIFYYICEILYFIDTVLTISHRAMLPYQKTKTYAPKNAILLVLDVVTLLPYYEVYYVLQLSSKGKNYEFSVDYMKAKAYVRLVNVHLFFHNVNNQPGLNHVFVTTVKQIVIVYLYTMITSAIFYNIKFFYPRNWSINLVYHNFNNESSIQWFILTNCIIGNVFAHNWTGLIVPTNMIENLLFSGTMIVGFLMHIMIFFGNLTALYIKKIADQFEFSSRLFVIANMLDDWNVPSKTKREAINIYNKFWEKRYGRKDMPEYFQMLPKSLRSDCTVDIFWHGLKHSYFFTDLDFSFLKSLSLYMENEFYMPGEFLYRNKQVKRKMMYIVSGVVQVLSQEDHCSSVISFSGGTVLGEISCLMPFNSMVNIRCVTYCVIQTIDLKILARQMQKYAGISKQLHGKLRDRFAMAREMQHEELLKIKNRTQKRTSVKWIKQQWRCIYYENKHSKRTYEEKHNKCTVYHTSQYLGLYVLSDDVELKEKAICLKSTCPFVLEPGSSFKAFCDYFIMLITLMQSIILPYVCFFGSMLSMKRLSWFYMLDLVYCFGIYLDISTAIKTNKRILSSVGQILIYRGKQIGTLVEVFSTLPLEIVGFVVTIPDQVLSKLRLNRILRIYKLFRLIEEIQLNVWVSYLRIRLIKYSLLFMYSIYFTSCFLYGLTCFDSCDPIGWLAYNKALKRFLSPDKRANSTNYFLLSLDYTASRLLSLTWGHNYSYSLMDIIVEFFIVMLGYYLLSFCFAELGACSVLQLEIKNKYQRYLRGLKHFVIRKKIPGGLRKFMYNMVQCHWRYIRRYEITGPQSIIKDMPDYLKNQILISRIMHCLKTIPLFMECDDDLVWSIANIATLSVFPPNTVIMREETFQVHMGVILRGHCSVESSIPTDKYHKCVMTYSYGDCFPIMEMLLGLNCFLKVTSITFVELITIPYSDLMVCIKTSDIFHNDLQIVLKEHLEVHRIILTRQKGRLPEMVSGQQSFGKGDYFLYDINDKIKVEKPHYTDTFKELGQWKLIQHCLLRRTFDSTGKFFIGWEIIRAITSMVHVIYTLFVMKFFVKRSGLHTYATRIFQLIMVADFYIRMHTRYYNRKGILVTHPLYTARHYIRSSFILDLISVFPFEDIKLNFIFGSRYQYHVLILMCSLTRPLLLHRAFNGMSYLQEGSKEGRAILFQNIKYVGSVLFVLGILACVLETFTCPLPSKTDEIFYQCPNNSWIMLSTFNAENSVYTVGFICYYVVLSIFATCTVGLFKFRGFKEVIMTFALTIGLFGLRWFVLAKITSSRISGNSRLVHYQHNMNVFLKFMKKNFIKTSLTEATVAHYEHVWKKTKGYHSTNILNSFHRVVNTDFTFYLYSPALKATNIFAGADDSVLRFVSSYFDEVYFKKDADIIRCNDIRNYMYIVSKGRVEISIANDKLCTLYMGGMFGCFLPKGDTRQTIRARAKVNVDLLVIHNEKFNQIISSFPNIKQKMKRARFLHTEYLLPVTSKRTELEERSSTIFAHYASDFMSMKRVKFLLINPTSTWYAIYDYITNVHLATLSSLLTITLIVKVGSFTVDKFYICIYLFDVFFLSKIFIGFHMTYIDSESGLQMKRYSKILRRYLKSVSGFWLDLGTCFPLDWLATFVTKDKRIRSYLCLNRTLRFIFMIKYYTTCKNTLTVSKHLRWTYLMYVLLLLVHINACLWWWIACPDMKCVYYKRVSHEPSRFVTETSASKSFRLAYLYVINVFTSTGLKIISPRDSLQLIITVIMICIAQFTQISLTAGFASMLVLEKSVMTRFERGAGHVLKYLEASNLSLSLKNRVWKYYVALWTTSHGPWMPNLITTAPLYLQENIMHALYGAHLANHFLFKRTHTDFLRQLVSQLETCVFLPGMYITQKGDIDHCMYFIDEGEVIVYDKSGRNEVEQMALEAGKSFGEMQGLYGVPHDKSYKARFTSRILILKKKNWAYLIKWFPASMEQIQEQAGRRFRLRTLSFIC